MVGKEKPQPRKGGRCEKGKGALFSKTRTQKAPLFPTTWAHQARYVRRRELARPSEDPGVSEKGVPMWPAPGARWELCEPAGNFPATQHARRCHSHKPGAHVAGEPDGLYSRQRQKGNDRAWICLAPQPSCWPSVFQCWIHLSVVPKGRAHPSWVPWKLQIC